MRDLTKATLELCRQTISAHVDCALGIAKIAHFNTDQPGRRHHESVVRARWAVIESLIFAEEERIEERAKLKEGEAASLRGGEA